MMLVPTAAVSQKRYELYHFGAQPAVVALRSMNHVTT
jgi:hypothetical protein